MQESTTRPAAVAGTFYPGSPASLTRTLQDLFAEMPEFRPAAQPPKALIAPHAGYIYSGPIAARAYAALKPLRDTIRRVVLLGPVHRVPVGGLAVPGSEVSAFATPLGPVPLDCDALAALRSLPQVIASNAAHAQEHS